MVDIDRPYRYDGDKDEYVVISTDNDYVFKRRIRNDGSKPRFCRVGPVPHGTSRWSRR